MPGRKSNKFGEDTSTWFAGYYPSCIGDAGEALHEEPRRVSLLISYGLNMDRLYLLSHLIHIQCE